MRIPVFEYNLAVHRRAWRLMVVVSAVSPALFMAAIGIGLGGLVNRAGHAPSGVPYLDYLGPGLLPATTMQVAAGTTLWQIHSRLETRRVYDAMLASPLGIKDLLAGEMAWLALRLLVVSVLFVAVMEMFGVGRRPGTVLVVAVGTLTGLAFGAPIFAFTTTQRGSEGLPLMMRLVVTPLFLFGGVFFPVSNLPGALQIVVLASPLYHGVQLSRELALGGPLVGAWLHLSVLFLYLAGGLIGAWLGLSRRLVR